VKSARWLIPILLLAFALRLANITTMSLRADEASNFFFASQDLNAIVKQLVTDDPHPPFYFFILHFWVAMAGDSELAIRFLGVFAGTLVVALSALFGKILLPQQSRVAIVVAALIAINPSLIWDAQDAHLYPWLVLFSVASCVAFLQLSFRRSKATEKSLSEPRSLDALRNLILWGGRLVRRRGLAARATDGAIISTATNATSHEAPSVEVTTVWLWVAYIVMSALALYSHYIAAFIFIAQGILAISIFRRDFFRWLVAQFAIGIVFLPWFLLAGGLLRGYQTDFFPSANFLEILLRSLEAFTVGRVDDRVMPPMVEQSSGLVAALFFLGIFLIGLWRFRDDRIALGILLTFLFAPFVCFASFAFLRFSIYDERYVLYLAPAFLLVTARGLIALSELPKAKVWVGAAALIILAASAQSLYNYWRVPAFAKSPDWRAFTQKISADARPGDVLIQNYPDPALPYYLQNRIPRVLLPRTSAQNANDLSADLARLAAKYNRLWFQPAPGSTWDTEGLVAQWFLLNARQVAEFEFNGARLELYEPLK